MNNLVNKFYTLGNHNPLAPSVVHCKKQAFDVYIGRGSKWGNPFKIGVDGSRDEVIAKYREYLWDWVRRDHCEAIDQLAALHNKTLGCYCAPQACHGDVLVRASKWAYDIWWSEPYQHAIKSLGDAL